MEKIDISRAQAIAKNKGLKPGKVKGTDGVQFTKGKNNRLDVITWEEFQAILKKRGLAIYESGGWMKIMKARARTGRTFRQNRPGPRSGTKPNFLYTQN